MGKNNQTKDKKYKDGFSLVEIIIVIAIMAILVGVIALAVIPNINRSKESKDFSALDNILSAANNSVANAKIETTTRTVVKFSASDNYKCPVDESSFGGPDGFKEHFDELYTGDISFQSNKAQGKDLYIVIDKSHIEAIIGGDSKSSAVECEYTYDEDGNNKAVFFVSN